MEASLEPELAAGYRAGLYPVLDGAGFECTMLGFLALHPVPCHSVKNDTRMCMYVYVCVCTYILRPK
jgi:hypothetical protein